MIHLAVLASGNGSNFGALQEALSRGELDATIDVLVCNKPDAYVVKRAEQAGIPAVVLPLQPPVKKAHRRVYGDEVVAVLRRYSPQLIVLAGWMVILPPNFLDGVREWGARVINLHPALLPDGPGDMVTTSTGQTQPAIRGAHAPEEALRLYHDGLISVTGVTIHEVTPQVDVGPVILKEEIPLYPDDTPATLQDRTQAVEHRLLQLAVKEMIGRLGHG